MLAESSRVAQFIGCLNRSMLASKRLCNTSIINIYIMHKIEFNWSKAFFDFNGIAFLHGIRSGTSTMLVIHCEIQFDRFSPYLSTIWCARAAHA